jgi:hypothetical protein
MKVWQWITSGLAVQALIGNAVAAVRHARYWFGGGANRLAMYALFVVLTSKLLADAGRSPSLKMRLTVLGLIPVLRIANGTQSLRHRARKHRMA